VVTGLAPTSLCFVALGFSNTTWAGGSLPFPLQFVYGQTAANCQLLTSADATSVLTNVGGTATFTLPLPNALNLLGLQVHLQAAQLELDATLSVSGGATMTLGAK
jgi:hypothetical protein